MEDRFSFSTPRLPEPNPDEQPYDAYIHSAAWKHKRDQRVWQQVTIAPGMCWHCRKAPATEVHHITYDQCFTFPDGTVHGEEDWWQLLPVCRACHEAIEQRKQVVRTAMQEERTMRWLTAWAEQTYGAAWCQGRSLADLEAAWQHQCGVRKQQSATYQAEVERRQHQNKRKRATKSLDFTLDPFYQPRDKK